MDAIALEKDIDHDFFSLSIVVQMFWQFRSKRAIAAANEYYIYACELNGQARQDSYLFAESLYFGLLFKTTD